LFVVPSKDEFINVCYFFRLIARVVKHTVLKMNLLILTKANDQI
jgi:hypothetical protein